MTYLKNGLVCISIFLPSALIADQVHILDEQNGELFATNEVLSEAALDALMGGNKKAFGTPTYVVRDGDTGELQPIFDSVEIYELIKGGDGLLDPALLRSTEPPKVIDLDDIPEKAPIKIFPTSASNSQPEDGMWTTELISTDVTGCPSDVVEGVTTEVEDVTRHISFSDPMHPSDLSSGFAQFSWGKRGSNVWHSEIAKMPEQEGMSTEKTLTLEILSPKEISFLSVFDFRVPSAVVKAAKMAGISMSEHCNATVKARYIKTE